MVMRGLWLCSLELVCCLGVVLCVCCGTDGLVVLLEADDGVYTRMMCVETYETCPGVGILFGVLC